MTGTLRINRGYRSLLNNRDRYLVLYGGAGAGKSYFAAQKILLRIMAEPKSRILVIRKVARTLRYSSFQLFKDIISGLEFGKLFEVKDNEMKIQWGSSSILFAGLDDVEKLKSIAGITSIWIEEATELTEGDLDQVDLRLRDPSAYHQLILTFNPVSALHWIKKRFFDAVPPNTTVAKKTYRDNAFVDQEYRRLLEGLKDKNENLYNVYTLGEWGTLSDLVYSNFTVRDWTEEVQIDEGELIAGLDFGYNNPTAGVWFGAKEDTIYIYDELYRSKMTTSELIDLLKEKPNTILYPDIAEPDRIRELQQAGFVIGRTNKDVMPGINFLKQFKVVIHPRCVNFIKEIQGYSYQKDKDGNVLEVPVKFADHLMDAWRYGAYSHYRKTSPSVVLL